MASDSHHSIGEVLALLQDDFPDVTISKIRFLESQGLITPERTASGYRKFHDGDLERLRWILTQQKENFLPLKVIKDRLDAGEADAFVDTDDPEPTGAATATDTNGTDTNETDATGDDADDDAPVQLRAIDDDSGDESPPATATRRRGPIQVPQSGASPERFLTGGSALSMSMSELATATGLSVDQVADLDRYGLIVSRAMGQERIYSEEALVVCRLAASFAEYGVEPRHLRMYKVSAEREAGLFEQLVLPIVRNQAAGRSAAATRLAELAHLGDGMRNAMLRQSLAPHLL